MKTKLEVLMLLLAAAVAPASTLRSSPATEDGQTNSLTALLQQGLFEEQANRNLDAAISTYQSLAARFDQDRSLAATAIFRLGECYRAQGRTNEAAAQYQRILREFPDQQTLATLSRQDLAGLGITSQPQFQTRLQPIMTKIPPGSATEAESSDAHLWNRVKDLPQDQLEKVLPTLVPDAVLTKLEQQRDDAETKLAELRSDYSTNSASYAREEAVLKTIDRQISERISGIMQALKLRAEASPTAVAASAPADEDDQEIRRIQAMIQNSPDLINGDPLCRAAGAGQVRVATFLLDHGANINARSGGETPLISAANRAQKTMVELLLNRGADVNARDASGATALLAATRSGYQAVVEVLLAHRADVNAPYTKMNSENTPLHLAAVRGYANLVSLLLTNGANANAANNDGSTPLHLAVMQGQGGVVQMLLQAGADPNVEDQRGRTPLSYAAERGSAEIVRSLLAAKADPAGGKLDAPLLLAINKHDPVSAELLLKAGANPNLKGMVHWQVNFGNTFYPSGAPVTPMFLACTAKQLPLVQLLLKFKADPNDSQTDNRSPLFWVLDRPDIVRALLDAGARAEATETITFHPRGAMETFHETLLQEAANQNQAETVELLLQHGANPDVCEERGNSALHYAAFALADEKVFTLLLEHKVSPNVRNDEGRTPLDVVKEALQSSWGGRFDNLTIRKAQVEKLIALLHQRGALDNLPNWDRITVSRPSDKYSAAVFWKGTNDWNRFTLFEALLNFYSPPSHRGGLNYAILLPYPDLRRVTILRHKPNTTNEARIKVDLLNSTNGIDCARNVPLEFGDVVEVPEREHALGVRPVGLTASQNDVMVDFLKGKVRLAAGGENVELPVYPDNSSLIGSVLARPEARGVLLSSSDLSRVKVTRRDPRTGRTLDWTLNCSGDNAPDLWLRDGDVMEVPQR